MFEFSVASKYLIPRRRQLSVSIISILSVSVISIVVWLILIFFSVTSGLEKSWIDKLVAMTAPIRIAPTEEYYLSYDYNIDSFSFNSNYSSKSIGEKLYSIEDNPYDPYIDGELPKVFNDKSDYQGIVKNTFNIINSIKDITPSEYQYAIGQLKIDTNDNIITQACYLSVLDPENKGIQSIITKPTDIEPSNLIKRNKNSYGIIVAKFLQNSGIEIGDDGYLSYHEFTGGGIQEMRQKIHIAGFYDPGIFPLGGKIAIASKEVLNLLKNNSELIDPSMGNGINIWFDDIKKTDEIKNNIQELFKQNHLEKYWDIKSYKEYPYTREIIQQLNSEKNLFSLISIIILIVATSNIISMLLILVNDKKKEIGILRSMGASRLSIGAIFGICGLLMGLTATIIGTSAALLTLKFLPEILSFLSYIQGYEILSTSFYGDHIPNTLDISILKFVMITTSLISLLAGIIPAIKATLIDPANILRSGE